MAPWVSSNESADVSSPATISASSIDTCRSSSPILAPDVPDSLRRIESR